jgi:phosphonate transport system permease protein
LSISVPKLPAARLVALEATYDAAVAAKRLKMIVGFAILGAAIIVSGFVGEVDLGKFFGHIDKFTDYIGRTFTLDSGKLAFTDPVEWFWGVGKWTRLIGETILIAYLGTLVGGIGAFVLSFLAASNLVQIRWLQFAVRRYLEFCRTVPEIAFAMIFVVAFGFGPLPGVLALSIHTTGALGKLFFEVIENADMKPMEGLTSTGAGWISSVRFAILPQVLSNFVSYALLRFEINVREGAIMGLVGAGGIGQDLVEAIRKFYYSDVSAILILIVITVSLIDFGTERIRSRLINMEAGH